MKKNKGFTLLEILLVVAAISILAGIVIVALNPTKQLGDTRNAQRRSDVTTILNAVYQYSLDNNGNLPQGIPNAAKEICRTGGTCGTDFVDIHQVSDNGKYVVSIPIDPSGAAANGTGYEIYQDTNGRVTVSAMTPEQGATISVTR